MGARLDRTLVLASCAALASACGGAPATPSDGGLGPDGAGALTCAPTHVEDPGFTTPDAWTPVRGARIGGGVATIDATTMCAHGGIVQALSASPLACAVPLVLSVEVALDAEDKLSFAAGIGGRWSLPTMPTGVGGMQICLGAAAFGGPSEAFHELFLGMGHHPWLCPPPRPDDPTLTIGRVSIAPDLVGTCPLLATVTNGDFEHDPQAWTLKQADGLAEIAPGIGEGGSAAAHLVTDRLCEHPSIVGTASLPTSALVPHPALRVWTNAPSDVVLSIRMGSLIPIYSTGATYLHGQGRAGATNICIPRWAQGTVQPLELAYAPTEFAQECATPRARDVAFDDLAFVSEPACPADADLFDPGFEQDADTPALAPFWALERYDDATDSNVELPTDGSAAHTGQVGARFSASTPCPHASLSGSVTVPSPSGARGPALTLWYRTRESQHLGVIVTMNALAAPLALPPAPSWTPLTACLDPSLATRPDLLRFTLASSTGGGTCADQFPLESIDLDDVALTTDPGCPAM
jgi:hypothetical protein